MSVALALDLGTTSTAAVAIDERGRLVDVVRQPHAADIDGLEPLYAEQSPTRHWECAINVLRRLAEQLSDEPVCLGLTGQMHGVLTLDADLQPLGNLITWQDRRANIEQDGQTHLQRYLSHCAESGLESTGCRLAPGYAAVTLYVLQQRGEIPERTSRVALLADWVAARLTDGGLVTERSNAASTGVFDLRQGCWSSALMSAGGLDEQWFPALVDAGSRAGAITSAVAQSTGLPAGLPVIIAVGDNQASVIGSVPQQDPAIQITVGTGGQINWPIETFIRQAGMDTRPLPPDRLMLVGAGMAGGDAFAWVNRTVQSWLSAFEIACDEADVYARLSVLASQVPSGADGLSCEPFFRGTRQQPLRRGLLCGISNENLTPGHLARAVLEGIATAFYSCWEHSDARPANVMRIIGCGNGLEQNPLLCEALSRTFGLPVYLPAHAEAAACGAAFIAGVGVGLWEDLAAVGDLIELRRCTGAPR